MTEQELEKIYNEAYRAVYWTAYSLLKNEDDAEDIVQDTFVSLIHSYDGIKDKSKIVPWLKKVAANKALNRLTRTRTDNVEDEFLENAETVPEDFLPDSIVESEDTRRIIMDIINSALSEDVRRTLILFYFDEMSTREISEALGIPEGTVSWRISSAKKKIKKEVEKYEEENNTKLYGMAIPFLSLLFMKEAEQVPFKAIPASLTTLSASAQASQAGAAPNLAAQAAAKGTGTMLSKGLIVTIAASAAVSITAIGIAVAVVVNSTGRKPERKPQTTTKQTIERTRETDDDGWADPTEDTEETTTRETKPTQKITEDSIYINMDGMSAEEIVNNIFKTTRVKVGVTKDEYAERFVFKSKNGKANSVVESFYWQFLDTGKNHLLVLDLAMPYDKETSAITGFNKNSFVEAQISIEDFEFSKEVFEKFIERFKAEGYKVTDDVGPLERFNGRIVTFEGHGVAFRVQAYWGSNQKKVTFDIKIPLRGE